MTISDAPEAREDVDVIRRCQQGDIASLGALVARYQTQGVRLAYLLTSDHALADDIVQDSFLLAYRGIRRFRLGEPFGPWFYRIVTNRARQQLRHARSLREISLDTLSPEDADERQFYARADAASAREGDPAQRAESAEAQAALLAALDTLPHKQREAVVLRYYIGYTDQQIASTLDCRLGTVQQRLHAGRASLQQAIRRRYPWLMSALSTRSTSES
jgi:RNA polymerase sigma-70 factor (ECF subfamily)